MEAKWLHLDGELILTVMAGELEIDSSLNYNLAVKICQQ